MMLFQKINLVYYSSAAIDDFYWDSNKRNADALIALTGKYPDYEGIAFRDSPAKP